MGEGGVCFIKQGPRHRACTAETWVSSTVRRRPAQVLILPRPGLQPLPLLPPSLCSGLTCGATLDAVPQPLEQGLHGAAAHPGVETLPSWSFICLFPLHLSFTCPWWMAPCPLSCFVTLSFSLPLGRLAVFFCCVTLSKFLNLSEPVSPLVNFFYLLSTLVCAGCCVKHRYQKDK